MPVPEGIHRAAGLALADTTVVEGRRSAGFDVAGAECLAAGACAMAPTGRPCASRCVDAATSLDVSATATTPCGELPAATSAVAPMAPIATTAVICRNAAGTTVCGRRPC